VLENILARKIMLPLEDVERLTYVLLNYLAQEWTTDLALGPLGEARV